MFAEPSARAAVPAIPLHIRADAGLGSIAPIGTGERQAAMIHVLAIITARPGQREAVLEAFRANMPAVHAEEGCIEYAPAVDAPGMGAVQSPFGPDTFVVIEKWADAAALKTHAAAPHMAAYAGRVKDLIASRTIHVLTPAG
jgi:quinol monooxygenase YgiN